MFQQHPVIGFGGTMLIFRIWKTCKKITDSIALCLIGRHQRLEKSQLE